MKIDFKKRFYVNDKLTPMAGLSKMSSHCDAIIKAAEEEKAHLSEFAKWHQMRAAELKGH